MMSLPAIVVDAVVVGDRLGCLFHTTHRDSLMCLFTNKGLLLLASYSCPISSPENALHRMRKGLNPAGECGRVVTLMGV